MMLRWMSARTQSIALLVSLAVNVLLVSAIATYAVRGFHHHDHDHLAAIVSHMAARLPDADAAKLRAAYKAHAAEFQAAHADVRRLRAELRQALRAQPFDAKALDQATEALATKRAAMDRAFMKMISSAVVEMSAQGRARLLRREHDR